MWSCDVAILGAGPYGLSAAAHLRQADGLDIRIFGEPMSFWENHMPKGMLLRSPLPGTHISDPNGSLNLHAFQSACGNHISAPLPLQRFTEYGRWFQGKAVPDLDRRKVQRLERSGTEFRITTEDGETVMARRVIVAAGIMHFAWRPRQFEKIPSPLASHTCEHQNLAQFAGKRVMVIGGGQSALESAALLHEMGADVEVLIRAPLVRWLWKSPWVHTFPPVARLLYAPPDVGQAGISHLVARPDWFRRLPRSLQDRLGKRAVRPAGAAWLKPRCKDIPIKTDCAVLAATSAGGRVVLKLSDGSERRADHALLATGYRVDISRYPFLSKELLTGIRRVDGYPQLDAAFESSVPGLHFVGAPAAWSFGPLMRFVAGTDYTARALTQGIVGKAGARRS